VVAAALSLPLVELVDSLLDFFSDSIPFFRPSEG